MDKFSKGDRAKWGYFMNMRYDEFKHYEQFWHDKKTEVSNIYKNNKTSEQVMIKQLGTIIDNQL